MESFLCTVVLLVAFAAVMLVLRGLNSRGDSTVMRSDRAGLRPDGVVVRGRDDGRTRQ